MPWATAVQLLACPAELDLERGETGIFDRRALSGRLQMLKDPVHPTLHVVEQCAAEVTALLVGGLDEAAPPLPIR